METKQEEVLISSETPISRTQSLRTRYNSRQQMTRGGRGSLGGAAPPVSQQSQRVAAQYKKNSVNTKMIQGSLALSADQWNFRSLPNSSVQGSVVTGTGQITAEIFVRNAFKNEVEFVGRTFASVLNRNGSDSQRSFNDSLTFRHADQISEFISKEEKDHSEQQTKVPDLLHGFRKLVFEQDDCETKKERRVQRRLIAQLKEQLDEKRRQLQETESEGSKRPRIIQTNFSHISKDVAKGGEQFLERHIAPLLNKYNIGSAHDQLDQFTNFRPDFNQSTPLSDQVTQSRTPYLKKRGFFMNRPQQRQCHIGKNGLRQLGPYMSGTNGTQSYLTASASAISEPNATTAFRKLVVYPRTSEARNNPRTRVLQPKSPELDVSPVLSGSRSPPLVTSKDKQQEQNTSNLHQLQKIQAAQRQAINLRLSNSETSQKALMDLHKQEQQMKLLQLDLAKVTLPLQPLSQLRNSSTAAASLGLVSPTVQQQIAFQNQQEHLRNSYNYARGTISSSKSTDLNQFQGPRSFARVKHLIHPQPNPEMDQHLKMTQIAVQIDREMSHSRTSRIYGSRGGTRPQRTNIMRTEAFSPMDMFSPCASNLSPSSDLSHNVNEQEQQHISPPRNVKTPVAYGAQQSRQMIPEMCSQLIQQQPQLLYVSSEKKAEQSDQISHTTPIWPMNKSSMKAGKSAQNCQAQHDFSRQVQYTKAYNKSQNFGALMRSKQQVPPTYMHKFPVKEQGQFEDVIITSTQTAKSGQKYEKSQYIQQKWAVNVDSLAQKRERYGVRKAGVISPGVQTKLSQPRIYMRTQNNCDANMLTHQQREIELSQLSKKLKEKSLANDLIKQKRFQNIQEMPIETTQNSVYESLPFQSRNEEAKINLKQKHKTLSTAGKVLRQQRTQDSAGFSDMMSNIYAKRVERNAGSMHSFSRKANSPKRPYRSPPNLKTKESKNNDLKDLEQHTPRSKLQQNNMFPNMQINSLKFKKVENAAGGYRGRRNPYDIPMCPPSYSNGKQMSRHGSRSIGSRNRITRSILSQRTNSRDRSLKATAPDQDQQSANDTIHAAQRPPTTSMYQITQKSEA